MSTDAATGASVACSIAPMLSVRNGAAAVEFYKSAFGAIEVHRVEDPGGSVVSASSIHSAITGKLDVLSQLSFPMCAESLQQED